MIDMFSNYQNLSENYIPNNLSQQLTKPCSYTKLDTCDLTRPYELYNAKNELEGYYWYYGNNINLEFNIEGDINEIKLDGFIDLQDYLKDKVATLNIYNFRNEALYQKTIQANNTVVFEIDPEASKKLVKGVYTCELLVANSKVSHTVFGIDDCTFLVK